MARDFWKTGIRAATLVFCAATTLWLGASLLAQPPAGQGKGKGKAKGPQNPRAAEAFDPTGYWVSIVTEDWRYRMVTPPKGNVLGVPLNPEGRRMANAWDPAKDEADGNQCKWYGAASIMRVPGRLHITWQDDTTLKVEMDAGTQTRLFHFNAKQPENLQPSWQGYSIANWEPATGGGKEQARGDLHVATTHLLAGYLRKNGVPYSSDAQLFEWYDVIKTPTGDQWLVVTTDVRDPQYLSQPFVTSTHFKREPDGSKFKPSACEAR